MNTDDTVNDSTTADSNALVAPLGHESATADPAVLLADMNDTDNNVSDNPNGEAAKWRKRLRVAESDLVATQEHLVRYQRAAIERMAANHLEVPADLFDIGQADPAALMDENGDPDATKIRDAAEELLVSHPQLATYARRTGQRHPNWGQGQSGATRGTGGASWNQLLKG